MAEPAFWISLGAFVVSGLVGLGLLGLRRRQFDLEKKIGEFQLEELERRAVARDRADIRAGYGRGTDRLYVRNAGGGTAREVYVEVECPDGESPFPANVDSFPIGSIDPGEEVPVLIAFAGGCYPPVPGRVRWTDPNGTEREEELTIREL